MLELKRFPTKNTAAPNTSYDQEFSGRTFDSINFRFDGDITASGASTTDPSYIAARLMGTPELNQAGEPLVRMEAVDWLYLSAFTNGAFPSYTQTASSSATINEVATARIKFSRLVPGAYVNANLVKAFFRGSSSAFASAGDAVTAYDMNVRPLAEALEYNPPAGGFLRPRISQRNVSVASADSNQQVVINVEQDLVYSGIMISAYGATELTEVDGLVRSVRVELTTPGRGTLEIVNSDWGNLRDFSCERSGLNSTDVANTAGVITLPCTDRRASNLGGALFVPAGSAFTISLDSSGTAQSPYSSITPAAGDLVRITQLAFTPVSGSGDGAAQSPATGAGRAGVPGRAASQSINAPRNATRARRGTRRAGRRR